jgi:hypothetical protein
MPRIFTVLIAVLALSLAIAATASASVTSHICSNGDRYSKATFVVPQTDQYQYRLAAYDASGARILLTAWIDRGGMAPNRTDIVTRWVPGNAARALVTWKAVNSGVVWQRWANC